MTAPDRLAEIKARRLSCRPCDQGLEGDCTCLDWEEHAPADLDWLVDEVERLRQRTSALWWARDTERRVTEEKRLRELLARLEWADRYHDDPRCPACGEFKHVKQDQVGPHDPDCWLAKELGRSEVTR